MIRGFDIVSSMSSSDFQGWCLIGTYGLLVVGVLYLVNTGFATCQFQITECVYIPV
jgi:hypothetical protein